MVQASQEESSLWESVVGRLKQVWTEVETGKRKLEKELESGDGEWVPPNRPPPPPPPPGPLQKGPPAKALTLFPEKERKAEVLRVLQEKEVPAVKKDILTARASAINSIWQSLRH